MKGKMVLLCCLCVALLYACLYPMEVVQTGYVAGDVVAWGMDYVSYFATSHTSLENINAALIKAEKKVNLDDTYRFVYGKSLKEVGSKGDTGQVFEHLREATIFFQRLLQAKGLPNVENYILAGNNSQKSNGFILFAVVYRPNNTIRVIDKYDKKTIHDWKREDIKFYGPFRTDVNGNKLDTVIDWAGIPVEIAGKQKYQAIMLTLAANQVFEKGIRDDYWEAEKRWIAGVYGAACWEKDQKACNLMSLKIGFTK